MSKHVGNITDHGLASMVLTLYVSMLTNSEPWDNLKFDPNGVDEKCRRKFFGTCNTYSFFALLC